MEGMRPFGEYRHLARGGMPPSIDVPVLLVGFARGSDSVRQFRTQTQDGERFGGLPSLAAVVVDPATLVVPVAKGARNPYGDFIFVGRGSTSDIVLPDPSVSKSHAVFQLEHGRWYLRDNRARNGTFVDARRLDAGERVALATGAQLAFGAYGAYFLEPAHFARLASS